MVLIRYLLLLVLSANVQERPIKPNAELDAYENICFNDSRLKVSYIGLERTSHIHYNQRILQLGEINDIHVCFPHVETTNEKILLTVSLESMHHEVDIIQLKRLKDSKRGQLNEYQAVRRLDSVLVDNEHIIELDMDRVTTLAFTADYGYQIDVCVEIEISP